MKRAYFVDTSAYVAYAKNQFWTLALDKSENIYTPESIMNEVSKLTDINFGRLKLSNFERKRLNDLIESTNIVSDSEISSQVYDAHKRSIVKRQIQFPNTIMGENDIQLVESANSFSKSNLDSKVLLFTGDLTMASSAKLIEDGDLIVMEPFSKYLFEGTKNIKPHFVLEEAISDLNELKNSDTKYFYGNVYLVNNIGYVHSFTENPSERNKHNKSYLVNREQIQPNDVERMVKMYQSGGAFPLVDGYNLELNILKREPTKSRVNLVRTQLLKSGRNPTLYNQVVIGILNEFRSGIDSIAYTITGDQLKNVTGQPFYDSLYSRRSDL